MPAESFGDRISEISKGIKTEEKSFKWQRANAALERLLGRRKNNPNMNSRMREDTFEIPARLRNCVPINDVKMVHNHEAALDRELRHRHVVAYLPFGLENKRVHPVPEVQKVGNVYQRCKGRPFEAMTFTMKKNLLMADEERLWRMKHPDSWSNNNNISGFDTKTFEIRNTDDVVFDIPSLV